jgi:hypothetical protein
MVPRQCAKQEASREQLFPERPNGCSDGHFWLPRAPVLSDCETTVFPRYVIRRAVATPSAAAPQAGRGEQGTMRANPVLVPCHHACTRITR